MQEAIDYNALSWVRQELAETLKQARHYLEEYAGSKSRESLQGCVAHLHEARGPLQMVNLKGADLLTGEMEEVLADLLLDSVDQPETALELLMQGFLEIPEYLYSLRAGRPDKLDVLFPLVNSLRATRGEQPLEEDAVFSPDLSVRVPVTVFDMRAEHAQQDVAALARAARTRFQGGLLDWYRNGASGTGLQMLVDILNHLQQNAGSEPVARLWWVAAGVAELLQDGALEVTPGIKRLFGQIDRHIKRLMEQGEAVFSDVLTDDLLKNLLYQVYKSEGGSARIASIRSTYGLGISADESASADSSDGLPTCSEELLQTVSGTVREDIGRIKEQLDEFLKSDRTGTEVLATVADEMHALGNMLDMIGMDRLGGIVAGDEQLLRGCAEGIHQASDGDFSEMANTMVAIEDALADISASIDSQQSGSDHDDVTFRQGRDAVIGAVMDDMASAKESINEFLRSCGDFELLADVPVILNRIHGGLQMADQDRLAIVTSMVRTFIARELVAGHRELSEEDLDTLADAICSIEYCVEELVENRDYGHRAMQIAEDSIEKLGYACPEIEPQEEVIEAGQEPVASTAGDATGQSPADSTADATPVSAAAGGGDNEVTSLQVIDSEGDPEIIEIFNEEAAEELEKVTGLIPAWCDDPSDQDALTEIRRSLHTLKGSGRMVGAMATGEFSWAMEHLVNNLLDGNVDVSAGVVDLLQQVPAALSALIGQVREPGMVLPGDIDDIARQAHAFSKPGPAAPASADIPALAGASVSPADGPEHVSESVLVKTVAGPAEAAPGVEQMPVIIAENFPVLGDDADQEIVDIFLEEATGEFDKISVSIPAWITQPENTDLIAELQRSFHTMKGSGRMAGAMRIGEFCWIVELVFTRLTDGVIQQSASMFRFMGRVPGVLSQMLDQIRTGHAPEADVQEMMEQAVQLANGGQVVVSSAAPQDEAVAEASAHDRYGEGPSLVQETAGPAEAAPGVEQMPVIITENFPVLGDDADQEIVDIFLEEATGEFDKISVSIPAWITQPENTDLIAELQRSFHTMKGSGRMAGAMRIGEFCWIVELVFTRLTDGVIQQSASMFRFMGRVPGVLSQMLDQIRTGHAPEADVQEMMEQAVQLANGGQVVVSSAAPQDEAVAEASAHDRYGEGPSLVQETAGPAEAAPGVEQMPVIIAENFPVLGDDADQEIVDIFLEEATGEFDKISVSIPAWITQPENTDLIAELQRSFHTMKGSGRMAGAMRIGEFCWIVELVFTRLTDGVIQQSASMFRFMGRVPGVLSQMLDQIRTGHAPEADVQEMMEQAVQLANGGQVVVSSAAPQDEAVAEASAHDVDDDETSLIEIFTNECREHLQILDEWVELFEAPGHVSDSLYRALHTLSGISESAEMTDIRRLTDGLYTWFGALYEEQKAVGPIGYEVLRDCAMEITCMVNALPGTTSNEAVLDVLCTRIGALPPVEHQPPAVIMPESAGEIVPGPFDDVEAAIVPPIDFPDAAPAEETVAEELSFTDDEIAGVVEADALQEAVADEDSPEERIAESPADLVDGVELVEDAGPGDAGDTVRVSDATAADDETQVDAPAETPEEPAAPVESAPESQHHVYTDVDPALFEIFVEEATEIMDASEATLRGWSDEPGNRDLMAEFQRQLHTLKGSARMVELTHIGDLSHAVESVMTEIAENRVLSTPELFGMLADSHDRLADMLDQVKNHQPIMPATGLEAGLQAIISGGEVAGTTTGPAMATESEDVPEVGEATPAVVEDDDSRPVDERPEEQTVAEEGGITTEPVQAVGEVAQVDEEPAGEAIADEPMALPEAEVQDEEPAAAVPAPVRPRGRNVAPPRLVIDRNQQTKARGEQVKVQSDALDNMVNHAGEINIFRARMEKQISDYRFNLAELDQTISRLRDQLRKLEMETEAQILNRYEQESDERNKDFDPLEMDRYSNLQQLSRSLMESISDLRSLQELMESTTRDSETLLLQQSRVSTELQENLIRTRMIPFVSLSPRLRRIARQSARQLDKKVEVSLIGEDGEMDRAVLERIVAPLEHMLRNSVAHGIELPRVRKESGKPVSGRIDIGFERDGAEIVLRIADDGAGMNIDAIRSRAIERELIPEGSDLPDDDVIQFVLQTGFSTASEVTQISGRGVGLDVVNSEVKQLGGSLHIESEAGKGTIFTVRLPYTLAINQGMLVTAGDETFCVPLASVEGVVRFYPEEIRECYSDGHQLFEYGGNEYRLKHLGSLLGTGGMSLPGEREQVPVLLIRAGEKRIGFHVESLQGIREVVIKPVGPQLSLVDSISGATILGDGRVVMILDMVAVSRREASVQAASGAASSAQRDSKLVVMVVDDSITVRKVTTRLLERNGYKVVTAKDGVDAMGMLQESVPDIMLLDIEMPRMDGFELATHMRNDDTLRHVPIIMITSRTGDKHRERARQIGVQHYLGKPYQELDLLDSIHEIIGVTQAVSAT